MACKSSTRGNESSFSEANIHESERANCMILENCMFPPFLATYYKRMECNGLLQVNFLLGLITTAMKNLILLSSENLEATLGPRNHLLEGGLVSCTKLEIHLLKFGYNKSWIKQKVTSILELHLPQRPQEYRRAYLLTSKLSIKAVFLS